MSKNKKGKFKKNAVIDKRQFVMKLVLSDTCAVCKTPCARGMDYLKRMSVPGALGKGVPCILTRRKV